MEYHRHVDLVLGLRLSHAWLGVVYRVVEGPVSTEKPGESDFKYYVG